VETHHNMLCRSVRHPGFAARARRP